MNKEEIIEKIGSAVVDRYKIINHNIDDCISLGKSSRGNAIEVNRGVIEADVKIAAGFIEPHFFAGFSGDRKSIMPDVSSRRAMYETTASA